ncbi:universal stress protein [Halobacteriaceae archaeon SHR40]|uniref:universal stress protein n=1 Tax=Halovenus amylolytica TaxID=2500550 RepID=UPI000FE3D04E
MGSRILLPVDQSDQAIAACDLAIELFEDGTIVLLHVIDPAEASFSAETAIPNIPDSWYEREKERADEQFAELESQASAAGVDTERLVEVGKPAQTIVEMATETDIDHVVMGSHGRQGVSRLLLGSVAENVVRRSPVPVTVARSDPEETET